MPAGRPTKYRKNMPEKVVKLMSEGMSKTEMCCNLGITFETMSQWIKDPEKEEFSESIRVGSQLSQAWWEREQRNATIANTGNATGFIFAMKNRFRNANEPITDRQDHGHDIAPALLEKIAAAQTMTVEQLEEFLEGAGEDAE